MKELFRAVHQSRDGVGLSVQAARFKASATCLEKGCLYGLCGLSWTVLTYPDTGAPELSPTLPRVFPRSWCWFSPCFIPRCPHLGLPNTGVRYVWPRSRRSCRCRWGVELAEGTGCWALPGGSDRDAQQTGALYSLGDIPLPSPFMARFLFSSLQQSNQVGLELRLSLETNTVTTGH